MSLAPLLVSAAESGSSSHISPYFIGAGVLILLSLVMLALLSFGAGREHS